MRYFLILVHDEDVWRDTGEGPFESREAAEDFAKAEVGLPWLVVSIESADSGATMSGLQTRNRA